MTATIGRPSLPRISDGPLASFKQTSFERHEDWQELEALLTAPAPSHGLALSQQTSSHPIRSSVIASVAFAGLLAAAFWMTTGSDCRSQSNCPAPTATTADTGASPALIQGRSVGLTERLRR